MKKKMSFAYVRIDGKLRASISEEVTFDGLKACFTKINSRDYCTHYCTLLPVFAAAAIAVLYIKLCPSNMIRVVRYVQI